MKAIGVGTVLTATATWMLGWLGVPLVGLAIGLARPEQRPVLTATLSALLGWAGLLAWSATQGPFGRLLETLGGAMGLPGIALLAAAFVYAAVIAAAAASFGASVKASVGASAKTRSMGATP